MFIRITRMRCKSLPGPREYASIRRQTTIKLTLRVTPPVELTMMKRLLSQISSYLPRTRLPRTRLGWNNIGPNQDRSTMSYVYAIMMMT